MVLQAIKKLRAISERKQLCFARGSVIDSEALVMAPSQIGILVRTVRQGGLLLSKKICNSSSAQARAAVQITSALHRFAGAEP